MLIYKIDIITALKNKGYNTTKILKENILPQSTMQKFRTGEMISPKSLDTICKLLKMQPGDIIEYIDN